MVTFCSRPCSSILPFGGYKCIVGYLVCTFCYIGKGIWGYPELPVGSILGFILEFSFFLLGFESRCAAVYGFCRLFTGFNPFDPDTLLVDIQYVSCPCLSGLS